MRGVGRIFDSTLRHGEVNFGERRALARTLSAERYAQAIILPNSWKSALVPWLARIPRRTGYVGEMRWGIVNDCRRLDRKGWPRLVDRYSPSRRPARVRGPGGERAAARGRRRESRGGDSGARADRRSPDRHPLSRRRVRSRQAVAGGTFREPRAKVSRRRYAGVAAGLAERPGRYRGCTNGDGADADTLRDLPAARTSAPRSTSCRSPRLRCATTRG